MLMFLINLIPSVVIYGIYPKLKGDMRDFVCEGVLFLLIIVSLSTIFSSHSHKEHDSFSVYMILFLSSKLL
jgi:hypothetical protein